MPTYQNRNVTVVRDAKAGDPGFDANKPAGSQVIINDNGSEKTVDRSEVKG